MKTKIKATEEQIAKAFDLYELFEHGNQPVGSEWFPICFYRVIEKSDQVDHVNMRYYGPKFGSEETLKYFRTQAEFEKIGEIPEERHGYPLATMENVSPIRDKQLYKGVLVPNWLDSCSERTPN